MTPEQAKKLREGDEIIHKRTGHCYIVTGQITGAGALLHGKPCITYSRNQETYGRSE